MSAQGYVRAWVCTRQGIWCDLGGERLELCHFYHQGLLLLSQPGELLGTLHHLERVGLLARARDATAAGLVLGGGGARTPFAALRRALRLVVADVNSRQPSDAAYATPRREALAVFTQVAFNL